MDYTCKSVKDAAFVYWLMKKCHQYINKQDGNRAIFVSPIMGHYGYPQYYAITIEGSPIRGMALINAVDLYEPEIIFFNGYKTHRLRCGAHSSDFEKATQMIDRVLVASGFKTDMKGNENV